MPKPLAQPSNAIKGLFSKFICKDLPCAVLSLALFLGGIWLLSLRIPGWSLFWGLIITPVGFAFTIFTLDEIARNTVAPPLFKPVKCNICGKITYAKEDDKDVVCNLCREDISEKILKEN